MAKKEENIPKNTATTRLPLNQETTPATSMPIREGINISLEAVSKPLIIKILREV